MSFQSDMWDSTSHRGFCFLRTHGHYFLQSLAHIMFVWNLKERKSCWINIVLFEGRHAVHAHNLIIIMKMKVSYMFMTALFRASLLLDKCMFKKFSGSRCL